MPLAPSIFRPFVAAVIVIALWSCLVAATAYHEPLWLDEGISLVQLAGNFYPMEPIGFAGGDVYRALLDGDANLLHLAMHLLQGDVHPPAHYMLAELWTRAFGAEPGGLRLLSTLLVAMGALAIFSRTLGIAGWATIAGLVLVLLSPPVLFAAGNIRSYGLAFGATGIAFLFLQAALSNPDHPRTPRYMLAALIAAGIAALSHYFTMMVLGSAFVYALTQAKTTHRTRLIGFGYALSVGLIMLAYLSQQMAARPAQFAGFQGFFLETQATLVFLLGSFTWGSSPLWKGVSMAISILGVWGLWKGRHDRRIALHGWALGFFVMAVFSLFWGTDKSIQLANDRYFAFAIPSLAIGVAYAISRLGTWQTTTAAATILVAAACAIGPSMLSGTTSIPPVTPWQHEKDSVGFQQAVDEVREKGGVVIVPGTVWSAGHLFSILDERDRVIMASATDLLYPSMEEAVQHPSFVVVPAGGWYRSLNDILTQYAAQFEACGFTAQTPYLWVRAPADQDRGCTLRDPLLP